VEIMRVHKDISHVRVAVHDMDDWDGFSPTTTEEDLIHDLAVLQQDGDMHLSSQLRMPVHSNCSGSEMLYMLNSMTSVREDIAGDDEDVTGGGVSASLQYLVQGGIVNTQTDHRTGIGVSGAHVRKAIQMLSNEVGAGSEFLRLRFRVLREAGPAANRREDQRQTTA